MKTEILTLNGEEYVLNKIKEEDEDIFLAGCLEYGKDIKIKGFIKKFIFLINIFCNPMGIDPTKEYIIAYRFFGRRRDKKEREKEIIKFNQWKIN